MLNKLKIGTKLTSGFILVLILLLVVYLFGRYAIYQSAAKTDDIDKVRQLTEEGSNIEMLVFQAQLASDQGSITHEDKNEQTVNEIVVKVGEIKKKIYDQINDKTAVDDIMKAMAKFSESDSHWYQIDKKNWETALEERGKLAEKVVDELRKVADGVQKTTEEHFAITQDGKTFYPTERTKLGDQLDRAVATVNDIRRLCFQIEATFLAEKSKALKEELSRDEDAMVEELKKVREKLTTPEDQKSLDAVIEDAILWRKAILHVFECETAMNERDATTLALAGETNKCVEVFIGNLKKRAENTMAASLLFDRQILWTILLVSLAAIFIGCVTAIILTGNITSGIKVVVDMMSKMATEGDLDIQIDPTYLRRGDEIGTLTKAAELMLGDYKSVDTLSRHLARGEWTDRVNIKSPKDTMNTNLESMLDQVNKTLHEIDMSVKQVATGANEVSVAATALSSGAQESAASLEEITASMSEISSQTKQNAESAGTARDLAKKATVAASEGQEAMKAMNEAMQRITKNSEEVQRVIKVIDDIAFQTNLLALNAAVEAARAGQHGKGFAVVAEEVRNLAARSAKAARETADLIATSGKEIEKGGDVSNHTSQVLDMIVSQIKETTELIAGIAVASNEQAQGVNQVTIGLQQIDAVTQQNTASAEESASAANEMSGMAATLQKLVAQFQLRK